MKTLLAIWGNVNPPPGVVNHYGSDITGLRLFINVLVNTIIVFAGAYTFINFIIAGYSFLSAGGNAEKIANSWSKIWQSMLGLLITAGSFVLAGILGKLLFGDYFALVRLRFFTP